MRFPTFSAFAIMAVISTISALPTPENEVGSPFIIKRVPDAGALPVLEAREAGANLTKRATGYMQAFYGSNCDGGAGANIGYTEISVCSKTRDRHSFRTTGCRFQGTLYADSDQCLGTNVDKYGLEPGCYSVNTGKNWESIDTVCV